MKTDTAIDLLEAQKQRNNRVLVSMSLVTIIAAVGGLYLVNKLFLALFAIPANIPLSCLQEVVFLIMMVVGLLVAWLVAEVLTFPIAKRMLGRDELYALTLWGGYVPLLTPLSLAMTRIALRDMRPAPTRAGLLAQLDELDYYKYGGTTRGASAASLYDTATLRFYPAVESDFDDGLLDFLRRLQPFLAREGVVSANFEQQVDSEGMHLLANGRAYVVYTAEEQEKGSASGFSVLRGGPLINALLGDAGSAEHLYMVRQEDQPYFAFLTSPMYGLLLESRLIAVKDKPLSSLRLISRTTTGM